jgi:hypothetical protein
MNRVVPALLCISLLSFSAVSQGIFHTANGQIIDPEGEVFIAHGTNANGPRYWAEPGGYSLSELGRLLADVWGFDCLRLTWRVWENANAHTENPWTIEEYVQEYAVNRGMVVMIEMHDHTGGNEVGSSFTAKARDFWVDLAKKFGTHRYGNTPSDPAGLGYSMTKAQASLVWFNLRNEPIGGNGDGEMNDLKNHYDAISDAVRAEGAQNIIVLDGSTWANEYKSTTFNKTYGPHYRDNYDNVVMSIHYGSSSWRYNDYASYFDYFLNRKIPLIVGEISQAAPNKTVENTRACYGEINNDWANGGFSSNGACYDKGIGRLYWHFTGKDDGKLTTSGGGYAISGYEDGKPDNLTEEGKIVWADIRREGGAPVRTANADFTISSTRPGPAPAEISVDASGSTPGDDASIESYSWDFGDGESASGKTVSHTYESDGTYTIELTITTTQDETAAASAEVLVGETPPAALFISNGGAGDDAVEQRLESLGYEVIVRSDAAAAASDADGVDLMLISSTVTSGNIGTTFADVAVPAIIWETWLYDDMGMSGENSEADYGTDEQADGVTIVDENHPLAAGLSGTVSTGAAIGWGAPGDNADIVATVPGAGGQAAIFAYSDGDAMVDGAAPAPRVGFYFSDETPASLSADGWTLFDAAVHWVTDAIPTGRRPLDHGTAIVFGAATYVRDNAVVVAGSGPQTPLSATIYASDGSCVARAHGRRQVSIPVVDLAPGVYSIQVREGGRIRGHTIMIR